MDIFWVNQIMRIRLCWYYCFKITCSTSVFDLGSVQKYSSVGIEGFAGKGRVHVNFKSRVKVRTSLSTSVDLNLLRARLALDVAAPVVLAVAPVLLRHDLTGEATPTAHWLTAHRARLVLLAFPKVEAHLWVTAGKWERGVEASNLPTVPSDPDVESGRQ